MEPTALIVLERPENQAAWAAEVISLRLVVSHAEGLTAVAASLLRQAHVIVGRGGGALDLMACTAADLVSAAAPLVEPSPYLLTMFGFIARKHGVPAQSLLGNLRRLGVVLCMAAAGLAGEGVSR